MKFTRSPYQIRLNLLDKARWDRLQALAAGEGVTPSQYLREVVDGLGAGRLVWSQQEPEEEGTGLAITAKAYRAIFGGRVDPEGS